MHLSDFEDTIKDLLRVHSEDSNCYDKIVL